MLIVSFPFYNCFKIVLGEEYAATQVVAMWQEWLALDHLQGFCFSIKRYVSLVH